MVVIVERNGVNAVMLYSSIKRVFRKKTSEGIQLIKYVGVKTASPDKWFGTLLFEKSKALAASIKCLFFPFATSFCCQVLGHELWCTIQFSRKQSPNHFVEEY